MEIRELQRDEIDRIWTIDRREDIQNIYTFESGELVLKPEYYDMQGWPPGEAEMYGPILYDCFDHGGKFYGAFDGAQLIGVAVIEPRFIGRQQDQLQLSFLHVSREYRGQGLGRELFQRAANQAREWSARRLYISATPSENTVNFYLRLGCFLTAEPDPQLFAREPEDIHLEYTL